MLTLTEHGRSDPLRLSLSQQGKLRDLFRATIEPAADGFVGGVARGHVWVRP